MATFKKRQAGYKSKNAGDYFENMLHFFGTCQRIEVVRIPNGCKVVKIRGKLVTIPIKSPFDFIIVKNGIAIFLDCKTVESGNFCYSDLTQHQVNGLFNLERQGITSGYLIYYRNINKIIFYKASVLSSLRPKSSLDERSGLS